jgi:threonylcarbamoyladenosine tRNA methylthiotransferase MtaB
MKRKYTQVEVIDSLNKIAQKVPGAFIGMDVIVGFPTETDAQFEDTYRTLNDLPWTRIHVFPYSERSGTRAALMTESVTQKDRGFRAAHLRELSLARYSNQAEIQVNTKKEILVLGEVKNSPHLIKGLSHDYWPVQFANPNNTILKGSIVSVHVDSFRRPTTSMLDGYLETTLL